MVNSFWVGRGRITQIFIWWFTFVVIGVVYFYGLRVHPLHVDEHEWQRRGLLLTQQYFFDGDVFNRSQQPYYQYYVHDMPLLAHYIYGGLVSVYFRMEPRKIMQETNYNENLTDWNRPVEYYSNDNWWIKYASENKLRLKELPAKNKEAFEIILVSRYVSVIFALGALVVIFKIGKLIGGFVVGYLTMVMVSINPLFYTLSRQAMLESIPLFWFLVSFYVYFKSIRQAGGSGKSIIKKYLLLGLCCGLSFAVKLNGLGVWVIMLMTSMLMGMKAMIFQNSVGVTEGKKQLLGLSLSGGVMVIIFLVFNPIFWDSPGVQMKLMLEQRVTTIQQQMAINGAKSYPGVFYQILGVLRETLLPRGSATNFSKRVYVGDWTLFMLGLWHIWKFRRGERLVYFYLLVMLAWFALVGIYIKMPIPRYFLPLVPWISLVQAFGVLGLLKWIRVTFLDFGQVRI